MVTWDKAGCFKPLGVPDRAAFLLWRCELLEAITQLKRAEDSGDQVCLKHARDAAQIVANRITGFLQAANSPAVARPGVIDMSGED